MDDPLEIHIPVDSPLWNHPVLGKILKVYSILENDGAYELSWDHAKHMNHCCHSNTITTGWGFDIAVRDIQSGEQIRGDYGMYNVDYDMDLVCEFTDCRKRIKKDDFDEWAARWETQILDALTFSSQVAQPLWEVMDEETRQTLERYLQTGEGYCSVRGLKYRLPQQT
ncbi:MAG: SET domain-containing protein-lysine N-methyltransferase [Anaerolineales bacterium]|nr:SET domain-containing protein-lysine N-methyltransferase [Anaerolineales bacterium]